MEEENKLVYKVNPNMEQEELTIGAQKQKTLIYEGDAKAHRFGYMPEERWDVLIDQLLDLGLLEEKVDPSKVFSNEFLKRN